MDRKYSVFLSSTFEDLKDVRKDVMTRLFMNGYLVNNMESFKARSQRSWDVIQESIRDSDLFVMIIAGRYGSIVDGEDISFTEKEYNYAVAQGIPVLSFIRNKNKIFAVDYDEGEKRRKLNDFIERIRKNKLVAEWNDSEDLQVSIVDSLRNEIDADGSIRGWVKSTRAVERKLTETIMNYYHITIKVRGSIIECEQGRATTTYTGSALVDAPEYPVVYRDRVKTGFGIQHQQFFPAARVLNANEFRRNPIELEYEVRGRENEKLFFTGEITTNAQLRRDMGGTGLHIPYFAEYVTIELDLSDASFISEYNGSAVLEHDGNRTPVEDVHFCENSTTYFISAKDVPANANIMFSWNNMIESAKEN